MQLFDHFRKYKLVAFVFKVQYLMLNVENDRDVKKTVNIPQIQQLSKDI